MTIPNLWPDQIKVDILPPVVVLKAQAATLGRITQGIVEAEVATDESRGTVSHRLELAVPALDGARHWVLTVTHAADKLYPVAVDAECYRPDPDAGYEISPSEAGTYQQYLDLLRQVFGSPEVTSLLQTLIARSNSKFPATTEAFEEVPAA